MNAHTLPALSPTQAAQAVGTSRWSVMRAIKAGRLRATRDNRNCWRIAPEDLADWRDRQAAHPAHGADAPDPTGAAPPVAQAAAQPDAGLRAEVEELRVKLAVATARAEAAEARAVTAEAARDAWRAQAEHLAARPVRRSWWSWSRR